MFIIKLRKIEMKNFLVSLLLLAISNQAIQAQDLTQGLQINDTSLKPMQALAKPGYLQTVTDPSFGTTIRRITNAAVGEVIKPMYSTIQAWNADESLMILYNRTTGHILLNGITYEYLRDLNDIQPDDIEQIFWHFNDPDIFFYLHQTTNEFIEYRISNQSKTVIVDLDVLVTNCSGSFSMGNDVQMMSWDSDVFCFRCNNDRAYYYRISTGNLVEFNINYLGYTAPMPAPSGNYFYHNTSVYNAQGNLHLSLNESSTEHSCIGKLANGADAHIAIAFAQGPNGGCIGDVVAHNMQNGNCFTLTSEAQGYEYPQSGTHVSALSHKNTQGGWVAASMMGYDEDGQSLLDQELIIARANEGNVQVCRIGHHRADEDEAELGLAEGNNYFGEPHAVISPTGTRVLFGSDWSGAEDGISIDSYVVELPAYDGTIPEQPDSPTTANAVIPGNIKIDPTFEHIGILYPISGDENLNSNLQIEFRKQGASSYKKGAITMRSHPSLVINGATYNANHHAGSAMFLQPNTSYQIRLTLSDADGGGTTTTVTTQTKAYPKENNNFKYVAAGNGGGSGTSGNPYKGLQTAADNAQAGNTFIVRSGNYSGFSLTTSGTANAPITFRSENPREAIINGGGADRIIELGVFNDSMQHIIIDGLTIENGNIAIDAQNTQHLTIKNCRIKEVNYGIYNRRENGWEHDQYITNNHLTGSRIWPGNGTTELRAVDIRGNRNVVSFNTIEYFDDAVSTDGGQYTPSFAMDIHNNDIKSMVDDFIEVDFTVSNTRVYRNRGYNGRNGISLAPIFGGPCYVFRNELYNMDISAFKMNRGTSGMVIVHNSSSKAGNGMSSDGWQNTFIKNNVIVGSKYCFEEYGLVNGSTDDWDYNAYKSTRNATLGQEWFKWDNDRYASINDLRNGTNIEDNGLAIGNSGLINAIPPASYGTEYTPDNTNFQPYRAASFVNNGLNLDNINNGFVYDGMPDRGAYEYANTLPKFGVDFETNTTNTNCNIGLAYAINLSNNNINIQYVSNQNALTIVGLSNAFNIKIEDANENEIPSYINTNNELIVELCDFSNGFHFLVIQNTNSPNVYVKLLLL